MRGFLKAWMAMALCLALLLPCAAAAEEIGVQRDALLRVCSFTKLSGVFATDMWGNNSADMDVRQLLHGYETVAWMGGGGLALNGTVVTDVAATELPDGSRQYEISLVPGLTYNDGTPLAAADYVFSLLLGGAPEVAQVGGTQQGLTHLVGYEDYQAGTTRTLSGVRLLSETRFALRIRGDCLPYFYGLAMLSVRPLPMSVIAPGCAARDDGEGAYIAAAPDAATLDAANLGYTPGDFSAEMLRATLLDPDTGYLHNPRRTSGPYQLEGYDPESGEARFVVNERFIGNSEGQKPHIEHLSYRYVPEDEMLAQLSAGSVDVLNKVMDAGVATEARRLMGEGAAIRTQDYLRTGFAFLAFACEQGAASSEAVRRAVAMSFDKDALVAGPLGGRALRSYGYYGLGQWMASYVSEDPEAASVQDQLAELDVPMDLDGARALLEQDGWVLDAQGGPYEEGTRYKRIDGALRPLTLRFATTAGDLVTDWLKAALAESLPRLGVALEVTDLAFDELLNQYYRQQARNYDLFFLASNFGYVYDPYYDFHTGEAYQGMVNTSGLRVEALMALALDMRTTQPEDYEGYVQKWLAFQREFVKLMPMVPLYSNVYTDIYVDNLLDYDPAANLGWASAACYAHFSDGAPDESEETP